MRATIVVAAAAAVIAVAGAFAGGDDDTPLTGRASQRATATALEHVGGGTVTETATGDGGAAYEVEIRRDDGSQVDVELDGDFQVIGTEDDDDRGGDDD